MSGSAEKAEKKLTPKEKLFIDFYLGEAHFNATEAAELAGYKGNRNTLASIASQNLRKLKIKEQIDEALSAMTMPANAVLTRLTEIASGKIDDVLDDEGRFNFEEAKKRKKTHLIKKLKRKTTSKKVDAVTEENGGVETALETSVIFEEVEFELYSAHEALRDLGKYHKLFTDKSEMDIGNRDGKPFEMSIEDFNKKEAERLKQAAETLDKFDGNS